MKVCFRYRTVFLLTVAFFSVTIIRAQDSIQTADIQSAEKMYDLRFTPEKRDSMVSQLKTYLQYYRYLHQFNLPNSVPMPMWFDPIVPGMRFNKKQLPIVWDVPEQASLPSNKSELAYYSLSQLASLLKHKKISSVELTRFFIDRLRTFGDTLHCVISITEDIALKEASQADADLAKGIYRGPLQGIPYGLKDLFAVKGTHTTWGTPPYREQVIDQDAFVFQQLQKAGAVLVAKLSMGELAMDDIWFGGQTKNPWNLNQGSNGSSAGSASATVAGLVPFAIGTETYGSIVAPSAVCGATGLRPTFGSVARTGAMTLAWSSDRIGPICRSAEDAAMVYAAIHGADGLDKAARDMPFNYNNKTNVHSLKVAYARNYIDNLPENSAERQVVSMLQKAGVTVTPIDFPATLHANDLLVMIWAAESAAAFDPLTRSNRDEQMVQQWRDRYPNVFRSARTIPAVEYINVERIRYMIMEQMYPVLSRYDIIIVPSMADEPMALTCLTGNPCITLPASAPVNGSPASITFLGGKLYSEAEVAAFGAYFQKLTNYHLQHPPLFR
jgi:Asp-tRNA(Asn)/Glu-tRNA(Gln) amidotransferase A subunit family amidase